MDKIPIKIDLSNFFEDERKRVLLIFNSKWKTVQCLQKRVENLFDLQQTIGLLSDDGCFIPSEEPIEIIKFCTGLKAFVINNGKIKKKTSSSEISPKKKNSSSEISPKKKSIKNTNAEIEGKVKVCLDVNVDRKKRKYRSLESGFANSTPNKAKRIKNDDDRLHVTMEQYPLPQWPKPKHQICNKSGEISSTSEPMPPPPFISHIHIESKTKKLKSKKKEKVAEESTIFANGHKSETEAAAINTSSCSVVESKSITEDNQESMTLARPTSLPSSTFINESKQEKGKKTSSKNPFRNSIPKTSHIYYDESGEITTTTGTSTHEDSKNENATMEPKITFYCALKDNSTKKPRIFQLKTNSSKIPKVCNKTGIEIRENIVLSPVDVQTILSKSEKSNEGSSSRDEIMEVVEDAEKKIDEEIKDDEIKEKMTNIKEISTNGDCTNESLSEQTLKSPTENQKSNDLPLTKMPENSSGDQTMNELDSGNKENQLNNQSSIASMSCVDLSIDDDDNGDEQKSKLKSLNSIPNVSKYDSSSDVEEIIDLNETDDINQSIKNKNIKVNKIMGFCMKMTDLPEVGDILVFKVPYLSTKGTSCSTEFFAGKAEYINKRTKSIKILILDGHSELRHVPGKYLTNLDDSISPEKYVQMKPSDMIEPKILRKNYF